MASQAKEGTPLVDKDDKKDEKDSGACCSPATATIIALVGLVTIVVVKVQLTAWLFSMSKFPTAYSFYSAIVTDVMLIPMFLLFPKQWGMPTLDMFGPPKFVFTLIIIFTTFDMRCRSHERHGLGVYLSFLEAIDLIVQGDAHATSIVS